MQPLAGATFHGSQNFVDIEQSKLNTYYRLLVFTSIDPYAESPRWPQRSSQTKMRYIRNEPRSFGLRIRFARARRLRPSRRQTAPAAAPRRARVVLRG